MPPEPFAAVSVCAPIDPSMPLFISSSVAESPLCTPALKQHIGHLDYGNVSTTLGLPYCFPAEDADRIPGRAALLELLPARPYSGMQRRTCAVVGSSGLLRGSGLGEHVDNHDVVIRLNGAPARNSGFERDVGQRTTIRMLAMSEFSSPLLLEHGLLHNDSENLLVVMTHPSAYERVAINLLGLNASHVVPRVDARIPPIKPPGLSVGSDSPWAPLPSSRVVPTAAHRVAMLSPAVWVRTQALIGEARRGMGRPTKGALAVVFALHFCKRVSAFGFSWGSGDPREQAHYYRAGDISRACRGPSRICGRVSTLLHSPGHEQVLFRTLVEHGAMDWYPPANFSVLPRVHPAARCSGESSAAVPQHGIAHAEASATSHHTALREERGQHTASAHHTLREWSASKATS